MAISHGPIYRRISKLKRLQICSRRTKRNFLALPQPAIGSFMSCGQEPDR